MNACSVRARRLLAACGIGVSVLGVVGVAGAQEIQWRSGADAVAPNDGRLAAPAIDRLAALADRADASRIVIAFDRPLTSADKRALSDAGVRLLSPLNRTSYFARVTPGVDLDKLQAVATVTTAEPIRKQWKLAPSIAQGGYPEFAVVSRKDAARGETGEPTQVIAQIVMHRDVDMGDAMALLDRSGGEVLSVVESVRALVVKVAPDDLDAMAELDEVQWIEPPLPALDTTNAGIRAATGANTAQAAPYNLDGSGVRVMVFDSGVARATHQDFGGRLTPRTGDGIGFHANHVAGTVAGDGSASGGVHRGTAPGALVESFGFDVGALGPGDVFFYTDPGNVEAAYSQAFASLGCDVSNNSMGTNVETNGFDCNIQGDYGVTSSLLDSLIAGSLGVPVRIVWSAGNERQGSDCDIEGVGDYRSIAPPSGAKNPISVGAINSNDLSMTSFSSWGPVDDGRLKPDLVAPGCQTSGDGGITSTGEDSDTDYRVLCGTSMSGPAVAGLSALLIQDWREQLPFDPDPSNAMIKALLIQGADDLGNTGPDYAFGYGNVNIVNSVELIRNRAFAQESLSSTGETRTFEVEVAPGSGPFQATLAWDDPAATPNVTNTLINDLDLVVTDPNGVRRFPWTLNPSNPSAPAQRNTTDSTNNVEQVVVDNPASGTWTIEVRAASLTGGTQGFALATEPAIQAPFLSIGLDAALPSRIDAGVPQVVGFGLSIRDDQLVPGSVKAFARQSSGESFQAVPVTDLGGGQYSVAITAEACDVRPEFYLEAESQQFGLVTLPADAPSGTFTFDVGVENVLVDDNLETDQGWIVGTLADDATTGIWNRVDPQGTIAQPENDNSEDGAICWVTDGNAGFSDGSGDVDGGQTTLISPVYDLTGATEVTMSYFRWYSNSAGGGPNNDVFTVFISDDGGTTWTPLETVGPSGPGTAGGWINNTFQVEDFVDLTGSVRLRFIAADNGEPSLVEAAIDDLRIVSIECEDPDPQPVGCVGDFNEDGAVDGADFGTFGAAFGSSSGDANYDENADFNADGVIDGADFGAFGAVFGSTCE